MNLAETALVLDRLAIAYRQEIPPEALEVWASHLGGVDPGVGVAAAEGVIAADEFFPTVARFNQEVAAVLRQRAVDAQQAVLRGEAGPSRDCTTCGGRKWFEGEPVKRFHAGTGEIQTTYQTWKPCPYCAPTEHHRWLQWKAEEKAVRGNRMHGDDLLDFDPNAVFAEVHAKLDQAKEKAT